MNRAIVSMEGQGCRSASVAFKSISKCGRIRGAQASLI